MFLSAIWGSSFIFIKLSVQTIHPSLLTFYRLLIASIFLLFFRVEKIKWTRKNLVGILIISIFGNLLPFNLISWSELYVDSVVASSLIGTMPMFTFIFSLVLLKNNDASFLKFFGLIIGFAGMIIFIGPNLSSFKGNSFFFSLVILFSAVCYAFSASWVKKIENQSAISIATTSTIMATLLTFPVMLWFFDLSSVTFFQYVGSVSWKSFFSATVLGIICTGLAIIIFFKLIQIQSPIFASQSNYLIPCFGFIWSYIFLNESLTSNLFIGLIMIVISGYFLNK